MLLYETPNFLSAMIKEEEEINKLFFFEGIVTVYENSSKTMEFLYNVVKLPSLFFIELNNIPTLAKLRRFYLVIILMILLRGHKQKKNFFLQRSRLYVSLGSIINYVVVER